MASWHRRGEHFSARGTMTLEWRGSGEHCSGASISFLMRERGGCAQRFAPPRVLISGKHVVRGEVENKIKYQAEVVTEVNLDPIMITV